MSLALGRLQLFRLHGEYIVAVGDDHPLDASLKEQESVIIHGAQVAGVDIGQAVGMGAQGDRRLLGILVVRKQEPYFASMKKAK